MAETRFEAKVCSSQEPMLLIMNSPSCLADSGGGIKGILIKLTLLSSDPYSHVILGKSLSHFVSFPHL